MTLWNRGCLSQSNKPYQDVPVALDFTDRFLIVHPAAFDLGRSVLFLGVIVITIGAVTCFTGPFLIPAPVWIASSIPILSIGAIFVGCSVTKP